MQRRRLSRLILSLALAVLCMTGAAEARSRSKEVSRFPSWLTWIWNEIGCTLDPHGNCAKDSATTPGDIGCQLDPSGRSVAVTGDIGCTLDPDGRCSATRAPEAATSDIGCMIDPSGHCAQ
jgi:hypothetical protein